MYMPRNGLIAGSTLLLAAVLAGCSDQAITSSPAIRAAGARSSILTPVTTVWDFATIGTPCAPGAAPCGTIKNLGTSSPFTNSPAVGTITATTNAGFDVTLKDEGEPERGLGLCAVAGCAGDGEVGTLEGAAGVLTLTFTGFPAGATVTDLTFGSVQAGEIVAYQICSPGCGAVIQNNTSPAGALLDIPIGPVSAAGLVIHFSAGTPAPDGLDNDYTVRTVTTSVPAPASTLFCTPGFWKNKGLDLWDNGHGLLYNSFAGTYPSAPQTFAGFDFGKKPGLQNPTLLDVVSNPQIYGGPATNNVAALIGSVLFGSPINIVQKENCPDNLTIIGNFPPVV